MGSWNFSTTYTELPKVFYSSASPTPVSSPEALIINSRLAGSLGLEYQHLTSVEGVAQLCGNALPEGSTPIAQAYAGHQFGHFTNLGDGRAILLGEHVTAEGKRFDVQLKGSGKTPYSRRGDGRAAIGPMLREYLISEAMIGLGIPSTQSLAVIATGEPVFREVTLPGAILTRIAESHIRVGTFEFAASQRDPSLVKSLADYTIYRHFPEISTSEDRYLLFLKEVIRRQVDLVSRWMCVGFIHGVMNTDNMSVVGETIDYGPCAFMDRYDPATVFSSIDTQGRYSYENQPSIMQWNLTRFAETLLPILSDQPDKSISLAQDEISRIPSTFRSVWLEGMRKKLGFITTSEDDIPLLQELLTTMNDAQLDFTQTFFYLSYALSTDVPPPLEKLTSWLVNWRNRLRKEERPDQDILIQLRATNPAFIPRNHQVEAALKAAEEEHNMTPYHELITRLAHPFDSNEIDHPLFAPPSSDSPRYRTFCGT
jgi:uncharacterized protein YdiU (UPF0061 family)